MQVQEKKADRQKIIREITCTVCSHPQRLAIDACLASASSSARSIAKQFNLNDSAVQRHKTNHLSRHITKAAAKLKDKAASQFSESLQFLMAESRQYVQDAHGAIKMQKVTVKQPLIINGNPAEIAVLDADGRPMFDSAGDPIKVPVMVNGEEYREFRDVGAMAPAINAAKAVTELLGNATGELSKDATPETARPFVIIMAQSVQIAEPGSNQSEPGQIEDGNTIDVKAITS